MGRRSEKTDFKNSTCKFSDQNCRYKLYRYKLTANKPCIVRKNSTVFHTL